MATSNGVTVRSSLGGGLFFPNSTYVQSRISDVRKNDSFSRDSNDWRKWSDPRDFLNAPDTKWSPDDFSGRVKIYKSLSSYEPFKVDLMVTNATFNAPFNHQTVSHMGDTFFPFHFGKEMMTAEIQGILVDTQANFGKEYFMDMYRNYLCMESCARRNSFPVMVFPNMAVLLAARSVTLNQESGSEDVIGINMAAVIARAAYISDESNFLVDYQRGTLYSNGTVDSAFALKEGTKISDIIIEENPT